MSDKWLFATPIPLPGEGQVYIATTRRLSDEDWDYLMNVLTTMKPGLVEGRGRCIRCGGRASYIGWHDVCNNCELLITRPTG